MRVLRSLALIALCAGCGDSVPDGAVPQDFAPADDLATPRDLSQAADRAAPGRDIAQSAADLAITWGDLPGLLDLPSRDQPIPDLAAPRDFARPPDHASPSRLSFTLKLDRLDQGCMPIVPPDPLQVTGTLTITNGDGQAAGPFHVDSGLVADAQTVYLASFRISPLGPFLVPAHGTIELAFRKLPGTLDPALRCQRIPCGSDARVGLYVIDGKDVNVAKPLSAPTKVECTF